MKNCFIKIAALLFVCCAMLGCGKENVEPTVTPQSTTIYGTVFNSVTHEPVIGAEIEIGGTGTTLDHYLSDFCNKYSSSVSGNDGQFELSFSLGEDDEWTFSYICARCNGYKEYFSMITFASGSTSRMDINIAPN